MNQLISIASGVVCLYLLLGMVGCATLDQDIREAIKKRQQCDRPDVIIIMNSGDGQ